MKLSYAGEAMLIVMVVGLAADLALRFSPKVRAPERAAPTSTQGAPACARKLFASGDMRRFCGAAPSAPEMAHVGPESR
ncbi:hypothetical protein JRI60_51420 [Archangium violaceum]|uniref:hypothetical protein n=1 Tax=Archangium violaceum TaxID=83451 RepID=UPI001950488D|nr:hypothetical protein [Archangium violaceum]QRN97266.1 hypothetical protein JRI60_51420 [Archangium violaceum]